MEQLRFEGIEFARTLEATGAFLRAIAEELREAMRRQPILLRFDGWGQPNPQLRLFEVDKITHSTNRGPHETFRTQT